MADADGVHLGQNDLPPIEVCKVAPDKIIGVSCNSGEDVTVLDRNESRFEKIF